MRDLPRIVADTPVEKEVEVVVLRKGKEITLGVKVGRLEDGEKQIAANTGKPDTAAPTAIVSLGMTLGEITDDLREAEKINDSVNGVYILNVEDGSSSDEKGIKAGEIIVEVGQETVASAEDVLKRLKELKDDKRKNALLMVFI